MHFPSISLSIVLGKCETLKEYNKNVFTLLERYINSGKKKTGRSGRNLWCIFVLAQVQLCLNKSYEGLIHQANNNHMMRQLMWVERIFGYERIEFEYQNIYDNVSMLSNEKKMQQ